MSDAASPASGDFHAATGADIRAGRTADVYFERAAHVLRRARLDRATGHAEVTTGALPQGWPWGVFVGVEECVELLRGKPVDLWAMEPGTVFRPLDGAGVRVPVMTLAGAYSAYAVFETALLGFLCQASGVATKAARVKLAAGGAPVMSFGARRMHPAIAPIIDRAAFMGGCDGVSTVAAAESLGIAPSGTMPHALIITAGGAERAFKLYDKHLPPDVPRIALVDTYADEKAEAVLAARTIRKLQAVRVDTPGSRRGDFAAILQEVRWELDVRGFRDVGIVASGGLDESDLPALRAAGATSFGVGTAIANAPTINFALDIVENERGPVAKRGKFGGAKDALRCAKCFAFVCVPKRSRPKPAKCAACGGPLESKLVQFLRKGKVVAEVPDAKTVRNRVLAQLKQVST